MLYTASIIPQEFFPQHVCVYIYFRSIVGRRFFFILGTLYLYRCITMYVTTLPVPGMHFQCAPKVNILACSCNSFISIFMLFHLYASQSFGKDTDISISIFLKWQNQNIKNWESKSHMLTNQFQSKYSLCLSKVEQIHFDRFLKAQEGQWCLETSTWREIQGRRESFQPAFKALSDSSLIKIITRRELAVLGLVRLTNKYRRSQS